MNLQGNVLPSSLVKSAMRKDIHEGFLAARPLMKETEHMLAIMVILKREIHTELVLACCAFAAGKPSWVE
jgi:hypothetical protein